MMISYVHLSYIYIYIYVYILILHYIDLYCIVSYCSTSILIRFCKFGAVLLLQQAFENTGTCKLHHGRTCSNTKTLPTLRFNCCNFCNDCIVVSANLSRKHDCSMAMARYTYGITSFVARQVRSCSHFDSNDNVGIASSRCHSLAEKAEMGWLHLVSCLFQSLKFLKYPEKRPTKTRLQPPDMWIHVAQLGVLLRSLMRCQAVYFYCCLSCIARACLTLTSARESTDTDRCHKHIAKLYISCISCLKKGSTMTLLSCCCKQTYNILLQSASKTSAATVLHTSDI